MELEEEKSVTSNMWEYKPYWWNFVNRTHAKTISYANFPCRLSGAPVSLLCLRLNIIFVCTDYFRRDDFRLPIAEWKMYLFLLSPPRERKGDRQENEKEIMLQRTIDCGDAKIYDNVSSFIDRQSLGRTFSNQFWGHVGKDDDKPCLGTRLLDKLWAFSSFAGS